MSLSSLIKTYLVLNLIITGMPSIPNSDIDLRFLYVESFKPYYNWNTFNT